MEKRRKRGKKTGRDTRPPQLTFRATPLPGTA